MRRFDYKNNLVIGCAYGLLAALFNTFLLVTGYGQLTFHFGQLFVLLCLTTRGFQAAFVACLFGAGSLAITTGNSSLLALMIIELLVVARLYQRGVVLLASDIIFWCLVGIPISYIIIQYQYQLPNDYTYLLLIKQLLNGVIYTSLASIALVFIPLKWSTLPARPRTLTLGARIFYLSTVTTILPALLVALLFTSRSVSTYEKHFAQELSSTARQINHLSDSYLRTHLNVIRQLATVLSTSSQPFILLNSAQEKFPGFLTLIATNAEGEVLYGAPDSFYQHLITQTPAKLSVADRDYFQIPKNTAKDYVSDVFKGRGFGEDFIIAVSSPVFVNNTFAGIVEGSLNLPLLGEVQTNVDQSIGEQYTIVTDANDNVIHASAGIPIHVQQRFIAQQIPNRYSANVLLLEIKNQEYFYQTAENSFGWKTYVLAKPNVMTELFIDNMVILLITLMLMSGIFLIVVRKFSTQVTAPLISLIKQFSNREDKLVPADSLFETTEVQQIARQLQQSRQIMLDFNRQLEAQVAQKTTELSTLNKQLAETATRDPLTGLYNRRHFDEKAPTIYKTNTRNKQPTSFVAVDIDHFKRINDNYGHAVGDKCLQILAKSMRTFFDRESDVVARYGGEEFVMVLGGGDHEGHLIQLEKFRATLEQTKITIDDAEFFMTVSIGVVCVKHQFNTPFTDVMQLADALLYQSKNQGRNRITTRTI